MLKHVLLALALFASFSSSALAAEESCVDTDAMDCQCTDADGSQVSLTSEEITDGTLCLEACSDSGAVSYAFFCGDLATPVDQDNISSATDSSDEDSSDSSDPFIPSLNVPIPGLDLSKSVQVNSDGYVITNMIGLYVQALFSYGITLAMLFGVLMLAIAGFQYMTAGGDKGAVAKAKGRMQNTLLGIVLLMGAYAIAFLIDPRLTWFTPLTLEVIDRVAYVNQSGSVPGNITFNPPANISCSSAFSIEQIVTSMKGHVTYRLGGKGGPPPYPDTTPSPSGQTYGDFCPDDQLCLDCSGFVDYVLACADIEKSRSLGTEAIFGSGASEQITDCSASKVNDISLQPGDLISIRPNNGVTTYGHVWIYIGNGHVAESYGIGREGNALAVTPLTSQCNYWESKHVPLYILRAP